MRLIKQNDTSKAIVFLIVDSSDHVTAKTGLSPTVTISKNGGSFASPSGTVSEIGNGWYKLTPASADVNTLGPLVLHATATGADPVDVEYRVVAFDPDSATNLGLTNLDAQITSRSTLTAQGVWEYSDRTITSFDFDVTVATNNDKTGYSLTTNSVNAIADAVWDEARADHTTAGTFGKTSEWTTTAAGVWSVETRTLTAFDFGVLVIGYDDGLSPSEQIESLGYTSARAGKLDNLDAAISTRLAASSYTAPDNASITAIKGQTDKLRFTGPSGEELVLASASVDVDEEAIADAVVAEIQDQNLVQVVVQPLVANVQRYDGDGGVIYGYEASRIYASWSLDQDVSGHDLALLIFTPGSTTAAAECSGDEITITPQSEGCLVTVSAADTKMPSAGIYSYVLRDVTTDLVLLSGQFIVRGAPDVS